MRLGTRIFICYLVIFAICFYYPVNWMLDNLRTRYLEGIEDPLVDQANILAEIIGIEMENEPFDSEKYHQAFDRAYERSLSARIYDLVKSCVDIRVYMTDVTGKVFFHSKDRGEEGKDYSQWRDIRLTLKGEYGSRTTKDDPQDRTSSVLHVAAPIEKKGEVSGILTIAKPTANINTFIKSFKPKIFRVIALSMIAAALLSLIFSIWITRPIKRLTSYANDIRRGERVSPPKLDRSEIGEMGNAFFRMQQALEGKKYVEQYVQNLTHEIKSPLSAIRGAAELLEEKMAPDQRSRFLTNIRNEANRIQAIVDMMLELAELENKKELQKKEKVSFPSLVKTVMESKGPLLSKRNLGITEKMEGEPMVKGDSFLLHQAISNLIQNAIDFSPDHGNIDLSARIQGKDLIFTVSDNGPGIPDFALPRVFEKFFSLQRPQSREKSTGLGLNFAKEVAMLHNGDIKLENRPDKGVTATMTLPVS